MKWFVRLVHNNKKYAIIYLHIFLKKMVFHNKFWVTKNYRNIISTNQSLNLGLKSKATETL